MSQRLVLITGTSSGIGAALADRLLADNWLVFGVARREVKRPEANYRHIRADLAEPTVANSVIGPLVSAELAFGSFSKFALVNNAAVTGQLRNYGGLETSMTFRDIAINLSAPLALMDMAVRTRPENASLRIINISSGLAHQPMPGGAEYCASKAGLHMAGQVLGTEEHADTAVFNYAPGIVATDMQQTLRNQPEGEFPSVDMFKAMHDEGRLSSPQDVIKPIVSFLKEDNISGFRQGRFEA